MREISEAEIAKYESLAAEIMTAKPAMAAGVITHHEIERLGELMLSGDHVAVAKGCLSDRVRCVLHLDMRTGAGRCFWSPFGLKLNATEIKAYYALRDELIARSASGAVLAVDDEKDGMTLTSILPEKSPETGRQQ